MPREIRYVPTTDDDKKKDYFKYLSVPFVVPTEEQVKYYLGLKQKCEYGLEFSERKKMQTEGPHTIPEGYYLLESGGVLVAANVKIPHITAEMMEWWIAWHQLDRLRYTIWNPEDHFEVSVPEENFKRLSDPSVPIRDKIWNITSTGKESMNGEQPAALTIYFGHPSDHGLDVELVGSEYFQTYMGGNSVMELGPVKIPVYAVGYVSKDAAGVTEFRERWWIGYGIDENGADYVKLPRLMRLMGSKFAMLLVHCHKEYEHLDKFLAQLYAEQKDNWR